MLESFGIICVYFPAVIDEERYYVSGAKEKILSFYAGIITGKFLRFTKEDLWSVQSLEDLESDRVVGVLSAVACFPSGYLYDGDREGFGRLIISETVQAGDDEEGYKYFPTKKIWLDRDDGSKVRIAVTLKPGVDEAKLSVRHNPTVSWRNPYWEIAEYSRDKSQISGEWVLKGIRTEGK